VALESLVEPLTRGDPMSPLRWTSKSVGNLSAELAKQGHKASPSTVRGLLHDLDYTLQSNRKVHEGKADHPDRDAQFSHINDTASRFHDEGQPVISVDAKKKELVGDFRNAGREWHRSGQAPEVRSHDFMDKELGKAIPYGVYDIFRNHGWVNVGIDNDTSDFAVESIRQWWIRMGRVAYPQARKILVTADAGGSNSYRWHTWKRALQRLADELELDISVCHFPPGTSKWNKIEHRLFSHITQNWRGKPLISLEVIVNLIGSTRTQKGFQVEAGLDTGTYPKGEKVTKDEMDQIHLIPDVFHGEWNYTIAATRSND
jgi:hypothetical protein